jgi:hypothetical protein
VVDVAPVFGAPGAGTAEAKAMRIIVETKPAVVVVLPIFELAVLV